MRVTVIPIVVDSFWNGFERPWKETEKLEMRRVRNEII